MNCRIISVGERPYCPAVGLAIVVWLPGLLFCLARSEADSIAATLSNFCSSLATSLNETLVLCLFSNDSDCTYEAYGFGLFRLWAPGICMLHCFFKRRHLSK